MHFVVSNIPDLDDEEHILENKLLTFKDRLGYRHPAAEIHHYQSLTLIDQAIFTIDRPATRLAKEYVALSEAIVRFNLQDREAALERLHEIEFLARNDRAVPDITEDDLTRITAYHAGDGEILTVLARIRDLQLRKSDAVQLLNSAVDRGYRTPDVLSRRAELRYRQEGARELVLADLQATLASDQATVADVLRTWKLLATINPESLESLPNSTAVTSLDAAELIRLIAVSSRQTDSLPIVRALLLNLREPITPEHLGNEYAPELSLILIAIGRFKDAMHLIYPYSQRPDANQLKIQEAFNYGMAEWAHHRTAPVDLFQRVLDLHSEKVDHSLTSKTPNYFQCIGIAFLVAKDEDGARHWIDKARHQMKTYGSADFSAWTYTNVSPGEFMRHLDEIERKSGADSGPLPQFFSDVSQ